MFFVDDDAQTQVYILKYISVVLFFVFVVSSGVNSRERWN